MSRLLKFDWGSYLLEALTDWCLQPLLLFHAHLNPHTFKNACVYVILHPTSSDWFPLFSSTLTDGEREEKEEILHEQQRLRHHRQWVEDWHTDTSLWVCEVVCARATQSVTPPPLVVQSLTELNTWMFFLHSSPAASLWLASFQTDAVVEWRVCWRVNRRCSERSHVIMQHYKMRGRTRSEIFFSLQQRGAWCCP